MDLYRLDFPTGKSYVGISTNARKRFHAHARAAREGANLLVARAWRKHGAPQLCVLAKVEDHMASETERLAVSVFDTLTPKGYNATPGGEVPPTTVPAIAAKVGAALKGRTLSVSHRAAIAAARSVLMTEHYADPHNRHVQSERISRFFDLHPEAGAKLSTAGATAVRGKAQSKQHRARIAEGLRRAWARRKEQGNA